MVALTEENFVRRTDISSQTFYILQFLFACVCFHYTHLDTHIHKNHRLRAYPIFIATGRAKHLHKFALTRYPWAIITYTTYFTGILPHAMLMLEIESVKANFEQQTRDIVQDTRNDLNERNFGGDLHKDGCVLDEIKEANEYFLSKLHNFLVKYNSNNYEEVVIANDYFIFNDVIDQQEEFEVDGGSGGDGITPPISEMSMVNETKGLDISWGNCRGGSILLTQPYIFLFKSGYRAQIACSL